MVQGTGIFFTKDQVTYPINSPAIST